MEAVDNKKNTEHQPHPFLKPETDLKVNLFSSWSWEKQIWHSLNVAVKNLFWHFDR